MGDIVYIVYSALAILLLAVSCGPHFRAGNVGAIALVSWCAVFALVNFINHIVYFSSYEDLTPGWCDIVAKIQSAIQTGLCSACLCINRRLAIISSSKRVSANASKRLTFWVDIALVVIPPTFIMLVSYFVQGHRYDVFEGYGCLAATYWELEAVLGLLVLPLILAIVSFGYGTLSVYNFTSQRRRFQSLLQQNSSSLNSSRFFRLLAVSSVDMLLSVPAIAWTLSYQIRRLRPTQNWSDLHYNFGLRYLYTESETKSNLSSFYSLQTSAWLPIVGSFVYFVCFGMHDNALDNYIRSYQHASAFLSKLRGRPPAQTPLALPTLGTTVTSPSELHWTERKDSKAAVEDEIPYAFEERAEPDIEALPWGRGVHVKVERDIA